ncbi:protein tamozhennic [Diabrotica virgifera virgifera]|uniref:RanBP2-type domain-containing protein n=1 Tax=Diabrotica virgifera virgifera TaxID=50390 RepID=A0ABM5KHJ9_DIAVI|nr:protein tamozhennic [Diabrotica virgifera virgifera]
MVIMESCCLPENSYNELWQEIERCHLSYLEMDESPEKILQRNRLEDYIYDFLCVSGHYHKFGFHETAEVLQLSVAHKKDFSAYKAAMGFSAIQLYAGNLLAQPWRKEYRHLKTYCGFYKHQVEANLVGAEKMFEAMGYRYFGDGLLILDDPISPDRITAVSRDCLIAYVECQILKAIWEEVGKTFKISWLEVVEFRRNHICSPEKCSNALKCRHHQRQYQEHNRSLSQGSNPYVRCQAIPVPVVPSMIPMNHSFPPPSTHHHVGLPPQPEYMVNGCCPRTYPAYTLPYNSAVLKPCINNEYYSIPVQPNNIYAVPTGKLIEVEPNSPSAYDTVDHPSYRSRHSRKSSDIDYDAMNNGGVEVKDSQLEDWDYVYKNLESQGYNKDLGERGDVLSPVSNKNLKENKKVKQTNLDEAFNHLSVHDRPLKVNDAPKKAQKTLEATKTLTREKPATVEKAIQAKTVEKKPKEKDDKTIKKKPVVTKTTTNDSPKESSRWTCRTCTYLNESAKDICEMCGKSRILKDETPIEVGGAECSKCTLVNPKNMKVCQACGTSLVGSPTYI